MLKQGDGTSVVSVSKASRSGYSTWAVRITRANGEVITGYVDRESGVVVDWAVNQQPAAQPVRAERRGQPQRLDGGQPARAGQHAACSARTSGVRRVAAATPVDNDACNR